jgi:hypothetical protein
MRIWKNYFRFPLLFFLLEFCVPTYTFSNLYQKIEKVIPISVTSTNTSPVMPKKGQPKIIELKKDRKGYIELTWDLLGEYNLKKGIESPNLKKVVNEKISISGYLIPLDYSGKVIKEFLLVPYIPSCSHVPPPPPNMIINVKMHQSKDFEPSYNMVVITGKLRIVNTKGKIDPYMINGIYNLDAESVEEFKN